MNGSGGGNFRPAPAAAGLWSSSVGSSSSNGNVWTALQACQSIAVCILIAVVTLLVLQVQYIRYEISQQQQAFASLVETVQNQQQSQIQDLSQQVKAQHSYTLYQLAGTFTLLSALLTMFHMSSHVRSWYEPVIQRKIVAILWMSPIYGTTSFLSLVFPSSDGYLAVIRDFYEAYVIYTFLSFLIAVLGKEGTGSGSVRATTTTTTSSGQQYHHQHDTTAVTVLAKHADHLDPPLRCLSRWYPHATGDAPEVIKAKAVLTECRILALQFVLLRPLTSIASFVIQLMSSSNANSNDNASPWSYFWSAGFFVAMITNISVFFAFTGLLKFYHAVQTDLAWINPFLKFMAIKGIVFLTFWQGLAISILVNLNGNTSDSMNRRWLEDVNGGSGTAGTQASTAGAGAGTGSDTRDPHEVAAEIQNILICLEMLFFAIAHWCVFPAEEWQPDFQPNRVMGSTSLGLADLVSDVRSLASSRPRRSQREQLPLDDIDVEDAGGGKQSPVVAAASCSLESSLPVVSPRHQHATLSQRRISAELKEDDLDNASNSSGYQAHLS